MALSYEKTARVAYSMSELLRAGVPADRVFKLLLEHHRKGRLRRGLERLRDSVANGRSFYEGFAASPRLWPRYFLSLVRCCELVGILHMGLAEAADHFQKLAKTRRNIHMLWMGPLIIVCFGWLIRAALLFIFRDAPSALRFLEGRITDNITPVLIVLALVYVPFMRRIVDRVIVEIPVIGEIVRDFCFYQFTTCFRFLYMGAVPAADMVRLSADAVGNSYLSRRLAVAASRVERGSTFTDALRDRIPWPSGFIAELSSAELAGQLDRALERQARVRKEIVEERVMRIRGMVERAVGYVTALVIALQIYQILMSRY